MDKSLGIAIVCGIVVGAAAAEIIHKKYPKGISELCRKTMGKMGAFSQKGSHVIADARDAFVEGYKSVIHPQKVSAVVS